MLKSVHLDWFSGEVTDKIFYGFEGLFGKKNEIPVGNKVYKHRFEANGVTLFYDPKRGCKNGPYFLELRGEFWSDHESEWIYQIWPFVVKPSRVDVAWDYDHHSPKFLYRPKFGDKRIRVNEWRQNGKRTGFLAGKLPHQYNLYRKDIQARLKGKDSFGVIWRFEVRSGGPWLKKNWIDQDGLQKFYGRIGSYAKARFAGSPEWCSGIDHCEWEKVSRREPCLSEKAKYWENVRIKAENRLFEIQQLQKKECVS